tara:strand:+ start:331 stop:543 length:213 start_codon:yes stop_codon:yes gene_type:complete
MEFTAVVSIVSGLVVIGGLGYKLNAELSKIRTMLEVFMAKADAKWEKLDELEDRVKVLEKKVLMKQTGAF